MNLPEYEYRGLIAEAWDALRGDTSNWPDRHFYLAMIRQYGQPVLDVGCGTGRLLLDYLQQGIDIDGVDNSPEMLIICRHKADQLQLQPALYEQYLEYLALPRKYQTILVPSSSLQLITDLAAVDQVMARLYDHVLPGGVVVASIMTLWQEGEPLASEWEQTAVRATDGVTFRRVARAWFDPVSECEHTEDVYQKIIAGNVVMEEVHRRSPATRSYSQSQARALFERAGFQHVRLLSGFTSDVAKPEDRLFTVIGHKPSSA
ncbi:class I SAM-dependent methyltransferase [Chloroflexus sp.]|uniref:class I SAM-dependent methyltransferase n=1 Tax=Chloroflexus sp. TaxID=1904827 RepID=UPI002ACD779F|nr:class I SAM-dependent methyltransferase [Chloroflexus sp.]